MAKTKLGELAWALASPFPDELSRQAAHTVLGSADAATMMVQLFPLLMEQKVLRAAFGHLQRAGADLNAEVIAAELQKLPGLAPFSAAPPK